MKKSLVMCGVAALALASCTQNEVLEVNDSRTIGFSGTGINNITRADIKNENFDKFIVYGGYNETPIFSAVEVTSTDQGATWTYTPPQYWVGGQNYKFGAYAPAEGGISASWNYNAGLTLEVNSDMTNQNDVIYADATASPSEDLTTGTGDVSLTFKHLLSKVSFCFKKDNSLEALTVTLSDFKVEGLTTNAKWVAGSQQVATSPATGYYTNAGGTIASEDGYTTTPFYVIPQSVQAFAITANISAVDAAGSTIKEGKITASVPTTVINEWAANNQYKYTATLSIDNIEPTDPTDPDPTPIVFTGDVTGWDQTLKEDDATVNVPQP